MSKKTEELVPIRSLEKKYFLPEYIPVPEFENGSCKGLPTEWWFPAFHPTREQRAFHSHAIENSTLQGIWGGTHWRERRRMRVRMGSKPGIPFEKTRTDKKS